MYLLRAALAGLLLIPSVCRAEAPSFRWPEVRPLDKRIEVPDVAKANLEVPIQTTGGKPLYRLQCKSEYSQEPDGFEFMAGFQCRLAELGGLRDPDLLNEELYGSKDWMGTRGRLDVLGITGRAAKYPEFGAVRHFRLRGMVLTLSFRNVVSDKASDSGVRSFVLNVTVEGDPGALSAHAERPPFEEESGRIVSIVPEGTFPEELLAKHNLLPPYPAIAPVSREFEMKTAFQFNPSSEAFWFRPAGGRGWKRGLRVPISAQDGSTVYVLLCGGLDERYGWTANWITGCTLTRAGEKIDLLSSSFDEYSHRPASVIHVEQLYGKCAGYPEYGAVRVFRFRGLKLTIRFEDRVFSAPDRLPYTVRLDPPGLKTAHVRVSVEPDATAMTPVAPHAEYVDPGLLPRGCEVPTLVGR